MATLEQLIFGHPPDRERGRELLARSPGVARECADEVVRLCEGWGPLPAEGLRRPVLLSFPLVNRLASLPGDLHAVVRIAKGQRPVFHAVILSRRDYEAFDLNPYALAQEDIFLDGWQPDLELPRRQLRPGALAPLVSPPPQPADVGSVDEAVRQLLANHRLLLPLEHASSDSDRFLALVIAGLPRALRQDLRFASWAPSGTNRYSLAAVSRDGALFTSWQPYLMTSVLGEMDTSCEEYLAHVQTCLRSGDLASLEHHARHAGVELGRPLTSGRRDRPRTLTAARRDPADQRPNRRPDSARREPAVAGGRDRRGGPAGGRTRAQAATATASPSPGRPRRRPLRRRQQAGKVRRGLAILFSIVIIGAGAYYTWTAGHWTRLPGMAAQQLQIQTDPQHGVVDVASLYAGIRAGVAQGDATGTALRDDRAREQGLALLDRAADLLDTQGRDYLADVDRTLDDPDPDGPGAVPAGPLHARGEVLVRELRRLALARVALREGIAWPDLADLGGQALGVRLDSLLVARQERAAVEPSLAAVDDLLHGVSVRARQVGGLAALTELLAASRRDAGWSRRCARAVEDLGGVRQDRARRLRDDAALLLRLKRAEHATDAAARAYAARYAAGGWATPAVRDVLPAVQRRVAARTAAAEPVPPLLRATAAFYTTVTRLTADSVAVAEHARALDTLAGNAAVRFDPQTYGDHVERLRFLLLERQAAAGVAPDALPAACFADRDPQPWLDVLDARTRDADAAAWEDLADSLPVPFLQRWADHTARRLREAARARRETFAAAVRELDGDRVAMLRLAAAGGRCGAAWRDLARRATDLRDTHAPGFPDHPRAHARWQRVAALAARLTDPPPLRLAGVTVRVEPGRGAPGDVVVELQAGRQPPRRSAALQLGPSAPAGSGWVGTAPLDWVVDLAPGQQLSVRVLAAGDGAVLTSLHAGGWLQGCEPADLAALDGGQGVRISLRQAVPYWDLELPGLL
jgi:hypothetical protein